MLRPHTHTCKIKMQFNSRHHLIAPHPLRLKTFCNLHLTTVGAACWWQIGQLGAGYSTTSRCNWPNRLQAVSHFNISVSVTSWSPSTIPQPWLSWGTWEWNTTKRCPLQRVNRWLEHSSRIVRNTLKVWWTVKEARIYRTIGRCRHIGQKNKLVGMKHRCICISICIFTRETY